MTLYSKAIGGLQTSLITSWDLVKTGSAKVVQAHSWTGRQITDLTNRYLPKPAAILIQEAFWSAPTMLPVLILPRIYTDLIVKPLALMIPGASIRKKFGDETGHGFYAGIRNACLIHAVMDTALLATTKNPWFIVPIVQNLYMAAIAHLEANSHLKPTATEILEKSAS